MHSKALDEEYFRLLKRNNLKPRADRLSLSKIAELLDDAKRRATIEGMGFDYTRNLSPEMLLRELGSAPGYQPLLDMFSKDLEETIGKAYSRFKLCVQLREYPTGLFNAQAYPCAAGALLLVNKGALDLIANLLTVHMSCLPIRHIDPQGNLLPNRSSYDEWWSSPADKQKAARGIAILIFLYESFRLTAIGPPLQAGFWAGLYNRLALASQRFLVAHEYAHAVAGHLDSPRTASATTAFGDLKVATKTHAQKFEADRLAAEILLVSWYRKTTAEQLEQDKVRLLGDIMAAGSCLFFAFDDLLVGAEEIFGIKQPSQVSHPPSSERLKAIREFYFRAGGQSMLDPADRELDWLGRIRQDVFRELRNLEQECPGDVFSGKR